MKGGYSNVDENGHGTHASGRYNMDGWIGIYDYHIHAYTIALVVSSSQQF